MTTEQPATTGNALTGANLFDISAPIRITYSRSSFTGEPQLSYRDAELDLTFQGSDQLLQTQTPVGELVSVTVHVVPDAFTRLITLLVPTIRLAMGDELDFSTLLWETVDRSGAFVRPPGPAGVLQSYQAHQVHGTAKVVAF
jgi:hypothetical protein